MRRYRLLQLDAFTDVPPHGNPCAVVLDADALADTERLPIARGMNLSETVRVGGTAVAVLEGELRLPDRQDPA